ncbi:F178B protein, partial [Chunga burmeisteri]|nr:F178B protein [Chunga burmeisteri]
FPRGAEAGPRHGRPLSSARVPLSGLFSYGFQASLQRYQQLRALKHLPVGRRVTPPPPGLLEPWAPGSSPTNSPPRASQRPQGTDRVQAAMTQRGGQVTPALSPQPSPCPKGFCGDPCAVPTAPRHPKESNGTRKHGSPQPHAKQQDAASEGSSACQVALDSSSHVLVLPEVAAGSLGGKANCGVPSPCPNRSNAREQHQAARLQTSPAWVHVDNASPWESLDKDTQPPEEHRYPSHPCLGRGLGGSAWRLLPARHCPPTRRDLLARFTVTPRSIPTLHPGEPVFCARPAPAPTLYTCGLEPQSALEGLFLCNSPACQADFVCDGGLSLLYRSVPTCPLPVLHWLFQLTILCPDMPNAAQALWEIWLSSGGKPWCPTVEEISWAFTRLGADLSPLHRQCLLSPELCPTHRSLDPSPSPRQASPDAISPLALVTQLGDICKFLVLCVVTQPCHYTDGVRLALIIILSFLGLDRSLRCQPLPELQHLLRCLLEGIRDWQEQGASPAPEPSCHGPTAEGATRHCATPCGA